MHVKSLALKTNLMKDKFLAEVKEEKEYIVVKTPSRPEYFWGNYIIMKEAPQKGCLKDWLNVFESEIGSRHKTGFIAITFDDPNLEVEKLKEFEEFGFDIQVSKILIAREVVKPVKVNTELEIRLIDLDNELDSYADIHFTSNWGYGSDEVQRKFLCDSAEEFRGFSKTGNAQRFGAVLNNKIIAELGVFWEDGVARFNNVGTHMDYRRLGACSTLVFEVSKMLLAREEVEILVMEADEDYHAASIYESIGFVPKEKLFALEWKDKRKYEVTQK